MQSVGVLRDPSGHIIGHITAPSSGDKAGAVQLALEKLLASVVSCLEDGELSALLDVAVAHVADPAPGADVPRPASTSLSRRST